MTSQHIMLNELFGVMEYDFINSLVQYGFRLHPPAIVGVMGSSAAVARLLGLGPQKCRHAMAIAASFAGAPMANAGTTTKPLHAGKAARFGLEAALLADIGMEGNPDILDMPSGFPAYFNDFRPEILLENICDQNQVILHNQDVAIKRFPCHLGMHWGIDAAFVAHRRLLDDFGKIPSRHIRQIDIVAPKSKYIDRPIPETEHDARHSFQFTACSALIDGVVTPSSFEETSRCRENLTDLLSKTVIHTPDDNIPSFDNMYVEIFVTLTNDHVIHSRCDTPYCHWRKPLSDDDVIGKFVQNVDKVSENPVHIVNVVKKMSNSSAVSELFHTNWKLNASFVEKKYLCTPFLSKNVVIFLVIKRVAYESTCICTFIFGFI